MKAKYKRKNHPLLIPLTIVGALLMALFVYVFLRWELVNVGVPNTVGQADGANYSVMDSYDMRMTNEISSALEGVLSIEKVYWLKDEDLIAPKPNQDNFGTSTDPASLQWLLDEAAELLDMDAEEFMFSTDITIRPGSEINYYLDETIFAISWQEVINSGVYTFGEVKIAHPSQFRRFLAGGTYGSDKQFTTSSMARDVNAVLASSGDFYKFRGYGIVVYDGEVRRIKSNVDTCFVDDQGDLTFIHRGELATQEEAQKYVDEHNIRFSLAFGPILIENGEIYETKGGYPCGEINDTYPRAGLAQLGDLHYAVVTLNRWQQWNTSATTREFAEVLLAKGCPKAYTLDGGQTGVITMGETMMNPLQYGEQRAISDIFYFATALPEGD